MSQARYELEEKVKRKILEYSFYRPESAIIIAGTLIFAAIDALFNPGWLPHPLITILLGTAAEAALMYVNMKDPSTAQKVVEDMFRTDFDPNRLNNGNLQKKINTALDYRSRIEAAIQSQAEGVLKNNLTSTAEQIDDWLENIYSLAQRLDNHDRERDLLHRDYKHATQRIQELEKKLQREKDTAVSNQIELTLGSLRRQVETIESLDNTMKRAELQMDTTLSALGTIYSQAMLVDAKDIDRGRAQRLQQEIAEEVTDLSDILSAMDDVYAANGTLEATS
jgi:predicted RNase H-like nuclease (RuvC/YqgF family)